jgi:hypothetical protein
MDFCSFFSLRKAGALVSGQEYSAGSTRNRRTADAPVAPPGWLVFAERPTAEAYAPLDEIALFGMLPANRERCAEAPVLFARDVD